MPTQPDGGSELWRRRLERLREKFIVIADRQRKEPAEFLELVLVHYDVGCEAHRLATEKHLDIRQIKVPGSKASAPKRRFMTLQNRRPMIGEKKYESVETVAGRFSRRYDENGKQAWRCVYPRMRLPIVTNVQSDAEFMERRGRIQRSEWEFRELADEGTDILGISPAQIIERFPVRSWKHYGSARWVLCLFDLAWIGIPGLNSGRWIASPIAECPLEFPYDVTCFQQAGDYADVPQQFPEIQPYFDDWAVELPGCFFSILPNVNEASVAFIDWLLSVANATPAKNVDEQPVTRPNSEVKPPATPKVEGTPVEDMPNWDDIERELFGLLTLKQRSLFEPLWEHRNVAVKWGQLEKSYTGSKGERAIQVALKEIPKRCVKSRLARVNVTVPSTVSRHATVTMTVAPRPQSRAEK